MSRLPVDRPGRRAAAAAVLALLAVSTGARAQLTMRVRVPAGTPDTASVFVAGSFNVWNPANASYRLTRTGDGEYSITLPADVRGGIEFKFTRGSWERVETDSAGGGVNNRHFIVPAEGAAAWTGAVAAWQDPAKIQPRAPSRTASVAVLDTAFAIPQLGRARRVWIYLPPGYASSNRRYPVLYMHDGQNVFDNATSGFGEWGVDETLDSLRARGDRSVIVVAVDHGGAKRLDEYSPWRNARYGGGEGGVYVDFLVNTLKPFVDRRFRTLPDRLDTGIAGSSMGGLISLYAVLKYPRVFGRAGVFSPALWFSDSIFAMARAARPPLPGTRIWFVTGAHEGDTPEVYVNDQRRMIATLAASGFRVGAQVDSAVRADGQHSEWFWRREFPLAYRWLFASPTTGNGDASAGRRHARRTRHPRATPTGTH
ncbi:alpha/beta hydrolase-fold protein [Longimicrobium sp.]|uniref:alpha/beta hydrolase-fold protein n=1 Tax=Longimicrobium sp. TaxID=2029185 RepID=UPI002D0C5298|nr:alpha/beta hydrolase-fold protein [Longimicrobium sp.]HSU14578.1 alpha/beta hydrolase-fold protein [Longimicrobium sp.]